jgi:hypothetical protein
MASDGEITPQTDHAEQTPKPPQRSRSGRAIFSQAFSRFHCARSAMLSRMRRAFARRGDAGV